MFKKYILMQSELIHDSDFGRYLEDFKEGMVIRH